MDYTFKLLAALLDYPTELTIKIVRDVPALVGECRLLDDNLSQCVIDFANKYRNIELLQWQQAYSAVFDVAPVTSLYLFEHIYGSSRKRGAAMSSLKEMYAEYGLEISNHELPDYLPVYLDFISTLGDSQEVLNYLADISAILKSIHDSLHKHDNDYALLLKPLVALSALGEAHPVLESEESEVNCPMAK